ncbi:hypothetical protein HNV12_01875 [Methanococcoides sp. SA1]|nr:hypothetical protein [Methanococcoides sp. SA1]
MARSLDLELKDISKIEGHTNMKISVKNGRVVQCRLKISEDKRFFTDALIGMKYDQISMMMSRICGTCSSAHVLCSVEAIEKAFGTKVTRQTMRLRNLLANAGHLRDHAMHLWFFVLPDLMGVDSVLDFGKSKHKLLQDGLDVKDAGNYLAKIVGGRAVHPPAAVVGGFTRFATKKEVETAIEKLKKSRRKILNLIGVLGTKRRGSVFNRKTNYSGLINKDYNFLQGMVCDSKGNKIKERDFGRHLNRVVLPYSNATAFEFDGKEFFSGALARMNVNKEALNDRTKKDIPSKYLDIFPSKNIFDNNLAQAIECLNIIDNSIGMLGVTMRREALVEVVPRKSVGVGVIEAPRGTLYYRLDFNEKGVVTFADLCIPTQQNVISMEKTIGAYVTDLLKKGDTKKEIVFAIEKMIRAYDPCMSCAAHFLKVDWAHL